MSWATVTATGLIGMESCWSGTPRRFHLFRGEVGRIPWLFARGARCLQVREDMSGLIFR